MDIIYNVDGMNCSSCEKKIQEAAKTQLGLNCRVDLEHKEVVVSVNEPKMALQVKTLIEKLGFSVNSFKKLS